MSGSPEPGDSWHTGSLDPGTGGVRDTYQPNLGSAASQAQYAQETERESQAEAEGRLGFLGRLRAAWRRMRWGA